MVYKGTAIRLGDEGDAAVLFDRNTLRLVAGWNGWLKHSDRRFGLLNTPTPAGKMVFAYTPEPAWANENGGWVAKNGEGVTSPLPPDWAKYRGLYVHGNKVVLAYTVGANEVREVVSSVTRQGKPGLEHYIGWKAGKGERYHSDDQQPGNSKINFNVSGGIWYGWGEGAGGLPKDDPWALSKPGPARWGKPIVTKLVRGEGDGPFAIDTLTVPYDNPFKALFFCTGLDFLPDGRIAVCTCHGDVWLVRVDEAKAECHWQRFATGMYHPLGLKVVDGKVVVLERGQLTRWHDNNDDGEADFYECLCNDWDTGAGEHSYDTCLETDPDGNFYFFKTGDTQLPTGGCLMKVSKDGSKAEVFATGFRHPIGLGMSPSGVLTGADQEGNWMPATRIDEYKKGGFYGDMRAHHRTVPPKTFDPPLCWLPREVDNSAGGQVWVPKDSKWPLAGLPLHLSYGRCKAFVLLRQPFEGGSQGGAWDLGPKFLSGVCRGRFAPDGNLYVCGLNGWQTCAEKDGCLQRVRYTGEPLGVPVKMEVVPDGVKLTFSQPLDRKTVEDPDHYRAAWWGYRWSGEYGSKRYKVSDPKQEGQDDVPITAAKLSADGRTVHVTVPGMQPVMQMQLGMNLRSSGGKPVVGSVFLTVHHTGK
jgi:hypothetical protein